MQLTEEELLDRLCDAIYAFSMGLPDGTAVSIKEVLAATPPSVPAPAPAAASTAGPIAAPAAELVKACDALLMFVRNLLTHPGVPRYRRLIAGNATFQSHLATCSGHEAVLIALGFVKTSGGWEHEGCGSSTEKVLKAGVVLLEASKQGRELLMGAARDLLQDNTSS